MENNNNNTKIDGVVKNALTNFEVSYSTSDWEAIEALLNDNNSSIIPLSEISFTEIIATITESSFLKKIKWSYVLITLAIAGAIVIVVFDNDGNLSEEPGNPVKEEIVAAPDTIKSEESTDTLSTVLGGEITDEIKKDTTPNETKKISPERQETTMVTESPSEKKSKNNAFEVEDIEVDVPKSSISIEKNKKNNTPSNEKISKKETGNETKTTEKTTTTETKSKEIEQPKKEKPKKEKKKKEKEKENIEPQPQPEAPKSFQEVN